jgi:hypothetical protein
VCRILALLRDSKFSLQVLKRSRTSRRWRRSTRPTVAIAMA